MANQQTVLSRNDAMFESFEGVVHDCVENAATVNVKGAAGNSHHSGIMAPPRSAVPSASGIGKDDGQDRLMGVGYVEELVREREGLVDAFSFAAKRALSPRLV
jgi:hypothetical protein